MPLSDQANHPRHQTAPAFGPEPDAVRHCQPLFAIALLESFLS
jgi:hypothetical protein